MPRPEEWQALFGATALIALAFAWYQIRQVDLSNRELIASNKLSRQVNIESSRPRVQVTLLPHRFVRKRRDAPVEGKIHISVQNIGTTPAHDVRLTVTPPFTSMPKFFKPEMMKQHFDEVNSFFDGSIRFQTLLSGSSYIWYLGQVPELFSPTDGIPRKWHVEAEYHGAIAHLPFRETFVLDLEVEKRINLPVDPLVRIGKDIEVLGEKLEAIKSRVPRDLNVHIQDPMGASAPRNKVRGSRPILKKVTPKLRAKRRHHGPTDEG